MSIKLKKLVSESTLTPEQKRSFVEAVSKFNEFGKGIYRENSVKEVVESIKKLADESHLSQLLEHRFSSNQIVNCLL